MKNIELKEFLSQADDLLINAALGDEIYFVKTSAGNAVIMDEGEYNSLIDAFKLLIAQKPSAKEN